MLSKKRILLYNAGRLILFMVLFYFMDNRYLIIKGVSTKTILSESIMNPDIGFNNLFLIVGLLLTAMFIVGTHNYIFTLSDVLVLKSSRNNIYKYYVLFMVLDAASISFEFIITNVIFCSVAFNTSELMSCRFYTCNLLYYITLLMYFCIIGITAILFKIMLNSNKIYLIITIVIFFIISCLNVIGIRVSPVYNCSFINSWFEDGTFDYIEYIFNLLKELLLFIVIYIVGSIIITKKDMIFNEE